MDKKDWTELIGWKIAAVGLLALVWWRAPAQIPVLLYKGLIVCGAVVIAHWVDHSFFDAKTHRANEIARALVFVAVVLAFALGL